MKNPPTVIKLDNLDEETARLFALADIHPVRVAIAGKVYRIERADHYRYYHPEEQIGKADDGETDAPAREELRRMIREVKPKQKSLEWGPETRYGREDDFNNGYNEALDEYETALLRRIETNG
jgi:hypothetical protein